ncbi:MAG: stage II sporulation protein P [Cellulosilyticaceae bacterium]
MLSSKMLSKFRYYTSQYRFGGYMLLALCCVLFIQWYHLWNTSTDQMGPLLFMNTAMSSQFKEETQKRQQQWFAEAVKSWIQPVGILEQAVPSLFCGKQQSALYQRTDEGAFAIPEQEEIVSLEKDNIYTPVFPSPKLKNVDRNKLDDPSYLMQYFFTGDGSLKIGADLLGKWDFKALSQKPIRLDETKEGPKVLIFHTHVKERYAGEGKTGKGVAAVGDELANILEKQYGIEAMHVEDSFYLPNSESVTGNYERMSPVIENILKENPSIEIVIDLHRDGINGKDKFLGEYNGKQAAKFMFVNGLCMQRNQEGKLIPMKQLTNPYLEENFAFSMQAQIEGLEYYPDLMRKLYLKEYRYSLHMRPNSLLVEVGNQNNTLEEAVNSAAPIAHIIAKVLEKD